MLFALDLQLIPVADHHDNHTKTYQAELQTPPVPFNVNLLRTKSDNIKFILVIPTTRDKRDW